MMRRKIYSGAFKAKVLSELIMGRRDLNELALEYQLHPNQIKNWKTLLLKRAHIAFEDRRGNRGPGAIKKGLSDASQRSFK